MIYELALIFVALCLGEQDPRRHILVHRVLAHHAARAQLVHELVGADHRHTGVAVRGRHVRGRCAAIAHLHSGGHDAQHAYELNVHTISQLGARARSRLGGLARAHCPAQIFSQSGFQ